jgi:hypothetical protein
MGRSALVAMLSSEVLRQPALDVVTPPANTPTVKSLLRRKAPDDYQRCEHPSMAPRESRYVMGGQELLEGGKSLVDPLRE